MKNLAVIIGLVVFILLSQQPAEAGAVKRSVLRCFKYGVAMPFRWVNFIHIIPGYCGMMLGGLGEYGCDYLIQKDLVKDGKAKSGIVIFEMGSAQSDAQTEDNQEVSPTYEPDKA